MVGIRPGHKGLFDICFQRDFNNPLNSFVGIFGVDNCTILYIPKQYSNFQMKCTELYFYFQLEQS